MIGGIYRLSKLFVHLLASFMNILRALYETFWNFISTVTTPNYHGCVDKILKDSENLYES